MPDTNSGAATLWCPRRAARAHAIVAWGTHGARNGRGDQVAAMLTDAGVILHCLDTVANGQPRHPLYVPDDTRLEPYRVREVCSV